jgi:hypothetical protein
MDRGLLVARIAGDDRDARSGWLELSGERGEPVAATRGDHQIGAFVGECDRGRPSDPGARAGDEHCIST